MKDYKAKIRIEVLSGKEKQLVKSNLPKKVTYSKHFVDRLKERKIYITKQKINNALTIDNLIDIQISTDNKITYMFKINLDKHLMMLFIVGENGNILTTWKTTKIRKANNDIYKSDLKEYKKIVC